MCWLITRTDGVVFAYTEHDLPFYFALDGGPSVKYRPESAFMRTDAIQGADYSIPNLDVEGLSESEFVIGSPLILEADVRSGKFDNAEVKMFLVNWSDLTQGDLPWLIGRLGEFTLKDKMFKFEVRGLAHLLTKRITEVYAPTCKADLFDSRCTLEESLFREYGFVSSVFDARRTRLSSGATGRVAPLFSQSFEKRTIWFDDHLQLALGTLGTEEGTPYRPVLISTATGLDAIRNDVSLHYALTADIDLTGTAYDPWIPIPTFNGGLDGRGYKIFGLHRDGNATKGLFRTMNFGSYVRRLGIEEADLANTAGSMSGSGNPVGTFAGSCDGMILDCYAFNCILEGGSNLVGGLVGSITTNGVIARCWVGNVWEASGNLGGAVVESNSGAAVKDVYRIDALHSDLTSAANAPAVTGIENLTVAQAQVRTNFGRKTGGPMGAGYSVGGLRFGKEWWTQRKTGVLTGGPNLTFEAASAVRPTTAPGILRSAGSFKTDGFYPGQVLTITGSASNNGTKTVARVTETRLWLKRTETLVNEGPVAATVAGAVVTSFPQLVPVVT